MLYSCWVNKCHIVYRTRNSAGARLLPYPAIFCQVLLTGRWNIVEVEMVKTGGRVHGVPAMFCHILLGFCYILLMG